MYQVLVIRFLELRIANCVFCDTLCSVWESKYSRSCSRGLKKPSPWLRRASQPGGPGAAGPPGGGRAGRPTRAVVGSGGGGAKTAGVALKDVARLPPPPPPGAGDGR